MEIFDVNYVRYPVSFFVTGFLRQETAALARAYLGIGSGTGDVTASGVLTNRRVLLGGGTTVARALGSSGSAGEVLTSNGVGADPSWQAAPSGGGTVTNTGTLTDHGLIVGNGGVDVSALAVGLTNTVLHGNTGADPSFSAVVEDDITLADVATNNATAGRHGFLRKLSGNATDYMGGDGNWNAVPAGGGTVTNTGTLTANQVILGNGGVDVKPLGALGTSGDVLTSQGAGLPPQWATPASGGITQLTGDVTAGPGSGSQAATIPANTVTYAKMQDVSAASKLIGRGDSGSGDPQEITIGSGLSMTGTTLSSTGGGGTVTNSANLTDNAIVVGDGGTVGVKTLASLGSVGDVLTSGGAGVPPSFQPVVTPLNPGNSLTSYHIPNFGSGTAMSAVGCNLTSANSSGNVLTAPTVDQLACTSFSSSATSNIIGYLASSADNPGGGFLVGRQSTYLSFITPISNTVTRMFFGVTNLLPSGMSSDTPTGNYACFRYSTTAANANWWACVGDGSSTEAIDTGVAVDNKIGRAHV